MGTLNDCTLTTMGRQAGDTEAATALQEASEAILGVKNANHELNMSLGRYVLALRNPYAGTKKETEGWKELALHEIKQLRKVTKKLKRAIEKL